MKSCAKFDLLFVNIHVQLHAHLQKWTLKFKLLHLLNHINCFNKICRMLREFSRTKSESLAQIRAVPFLDFFLWNFFIGAPCSLILLLLGELRFYGFLLLFWCFWRLLQFIICLMNSCLILCCIMTILAIILCQRDAMLWLCVRVCVCLPQAGIVSNRIQHLLLELMVHVLYG